MKSKTADPGRVGVDDIVRCRGSISSLPGPELFVAEAGTSAARSG